MLLLLDPPRHLNLKDQLSQRLDRLAQQEATAHLQDGLDLLPSHDLNQQRRLQLELRWGQPQPDQKLGLQCPSRLRQRPLLALQSQKERHPML